MTSQIALLARNPAVHLAFAFFAMGGWAVFANRGHPFPQPLVAGGIQGVLSAVITRGLQKLIEVLTARLGGIWALSVPPMAAFAVSGGLLVTVHHLSGTPELAATVALPLTVSTTYAVFYTCTCVKGSRVGRA